MLYAFGFERLCLVASDLYFLDPDARPGQEGAERGVRIELRLLESGPLKGSVYSARPILIDRPIWRVDLLETVDGPLGSLNRAHHHPVFDGWDPEDRTFVPELMAKPIEWVCDQLADLDPLLRQAGIDPAEVAGDTTALRQALTEIGDTLSRLLARVHAGELAVQPDDPELVRARIGWL